MKLLSCLIDEVDLIVDASVAINLNATGCGERILRALPNRVIITKIAAGEVDGDRRTGRRDREHLDELAKRGLVGIVSLTDRCEKIFTELVVGRAVDTLDDGEAATIAYALSADAQAIIDDKKAIRLCGDKFPELALASTVDILCHASVQAAFSTQELSDALFGALTKARMRVLPHQSNWVVSMIGDERASCCVSLSKAARVSPLRF